MRDSKSSVQYKVGIYPESISQMKVHSSQRVPLIFAVVMDDSKQTRLPGIAPGLEFHAQNVGLVLGSQKNDSTPSALWTRLAGEIGLPAGN